MAMPVTADLLVRRIRPILKTVDLSGFPLKFQLRVRKGRQRPPGKEMERVALIEVRLPGVDAHRPGKSHTTLHVGVVTPSTYESFVGPSSLFRAYVLATVRRLLVEMLHHELDEFFTVRGRRPFDPHVGVVALLTPELETVAERLKRPKASTARSS